MPWVSLTGEDAVSRVVGASLFFERLGCAARNSPLYIGVVAHGYATLRISCLFPSFTSRARAGAEPVAVVTLAELIRRVYATMFRLTRSNLRDCVRLSDQGVIRGLLLYFTRQWKLWQGSLHDLDLLRVILRAYRHEQTTFHRGNAVGLRTVADLLFLSATRDHSTLGSLRLRLADRGAPSASPAVPATPQTDSDVGRFLLERSASSADEWSARCPSTGSLHLVLGEVGPLADYFRGSWEASQSHIVYRDSQHAQAVFPPETSDEGAAAVNYLQCVVPRDGQYKNVLNIVRMLTLGGYELGTCRRAAFVYPGAGSELQALMLDSYYPCLRTYFIELLYDYTDLRTASYTDLVRHNQNVVLLIPSDIAAASFLPESGFGTSIIRYPADWLLDPALIQNKVVPLIYADYDQSVGAVDYP
jgi:hypothetical protein